MMQTRAENYNDVTMHRVDLVEVFFHLEKSRIIDFESEIKAVQASRCREKSFAIADHKKIICCWGNSLAFGHALSSSLDGNSKWERREMGEFGKFSCLARIKTPRIT
jgi:hypothetical protein